jgi:hypothetical protein
MDRGLIDACEIKFKSAFRNFKFAILASPLLFALSFLGAMLFALCPHATAQQAAKIPRIGYLAVVPLSTMAARNEPFRQVCASSVTSKERTS